MLRVVAAAALALVLAAAPAARAGIADSPLPVLQADVTTQFLYSVPGIVTNSSLNTIFSCTSTSKSTMLVGVQLFDGGGTLANDVSLATASVAPGATVVFGTAVPSGFTVDKFLFVPTIGRGSARVLATQKSLVCTALLVSTGSPPESMTYLTIIAKTKQKAAN